jgi:hypothetical protein
MKRILTVLFALLLLIPIADARTQTTGKSKATKARTTVAANNKTMSRNIPVSNFSKIKVTSGIKLEYSQSSSAKISVKASNNIINYVEAYVSGGTLIIGIKGERGYNITWKNSSQRPVVYVSSSDIAKIEAQSNATVEVKTNLSVKHLKLEASSASSISTKEILANGLSIEAEGASSVSVKKGNCAKLEIEADGASNVNVEHIICGKIDAEAEGASSVSIKSLQAQDIEADAEGSSTIEFKGKCTNVDLEASSASVISAKSLKASYGSAKASSSSRITSNVSNLSAKSSSQSLIINNNKRY